MARAKRFDDDPRVRPLLEVVRQQVTIRRIVAAQMGLSPTDFESMQMIALAPEPIGPMELAKSLNLGASSTTYLIDRLEGMGLLVREPHPSDRRRTILKPTPRFLQSLETSMQSWASEFSHWMDLQSEPRQEAILDFLREFARMADEANR